MRIDVAVSQELTAVGNDARLRAGLEGLQRRALGVDLVGEDPQMPGGNPAIFAAFEAQLR